MKTNDNHALLAFTKKEKRGILFILFINLLLCLLPVMYRKYFILKQTATPQIAADVDLLVTQQQSIDASKDEPNAHEKNNNTSLQNASPVYKSFDPNTITTAEWMMFGVKEKTALSIQKYIAKGGRFRTPADIRKIWGLSEKQKEMLEPYVNIQNTPAPTTTKYSTPKEKQVQIIDLNKADSTQLESLPGIGPAIARRIVLYRKKLGGFYAIHQLADVWGLPDSVYEKIKNQCTIHEEIIKIDINLVEFDALKSHPYFGYKLANALINYRKQHGKFNQLEDIQQIVQIDEKTYEKILPYLFVDR